MGFLAIIIGLIIMGVALYKGLHQSSFLVMLGYLALGIYLSVAIYALLTEGTVLIW